MFICSQEKEGKKNEGKTKRLEQVEFFLISSNITGINHVERNKRGGKKKELHRFFFKDIHSLLMVEFSTNLNPIHESPSTKKEPQPKTALYVMNHPSTNKKRVELTFHSGTIIHARTNDINT